MRNFLVLLAAVLTAGCAAIAASNEPWRNDAFFQRVQMGMTTDEVQRRLGPPDETMRFPLSGSTAWDYRHTDAWGYLAVYSITFGPDGRAETTISRRLNAGGDYGR
ncbi:MAG TPA: hypothetical protein VFD95_13010 [Usitatibacter sp.]|jgi:uncharacterized protein YceK|nr:hypothetical protein [Usitatibacter sp.]